MSILVNMEMPTSCDNCCLCGCYVREDGTEENYRCAVTMYPIRDFDKRHKHCPLVPVPPLEAPRKGHWLEMDSCMTVCSECGSLGCGSDYCPGCGADMREASE